MSDCGEMSSGSKVDMRSRTTRSMRRKANAELVLDELANRANATVAEVVDVVDLIALFALVKGNDVAHGCDDVFNGERGEAFSSGSKPSFLFAL